MRRLAASSLLMLFAVLSTSILLSLLAGDVIRLPWEASRFFSSGAANDDDDAVGTRWAVLIAGSNRYRNYKHQVKKRTANGNSGMGSHVMLYGDIGLGKENLFLYIGTDPANDKYTFVGENSLRPRSTDIKQCDADLMYFWYKYREAPEGSTRKVDAQKQFVELISHRVHLDHSIKLIGKFLFGTNLGPEILNTVRDAGKPVVDDWACLKSLVRTFEMHCGSLSQYGMKHMQHMRAIANICNAGIREDIMAKASALACDKG